MNKKDLHKMIKEASGLVEGVEEPFHSLAFSAIFAEMLHSSHHVEETSREPPAATRRQVTSGGNRLQTILRSNFDWSALFVVNKDPIVQNLTILKVALNEFKVDGLSARDIQQILFQKYRISKTPNAVSMSLMTAVGKYVDRIQEGKEFLYRITQKGIAKVKEEPKTER